MANWDPSNGPLPGLGGAGYNGSGGFFSNSDYAAVARNNAGVGKRKQNAPLHVSSLPPAIAVNGKYKTGRMYNLRLSQDATYAVGQDASLYAFNFLYNPGSVDMNTQVDWSMNYSPNDTYSKIPNNQTCSFQLLLNRVPDVNDPKSRAYKAGTLHDVEYLYRCINGSPKFVAGMGQTADVGFLTPTRLQVIFGPRLTFAGFITALDISHTTFSQSMLPTLTTVQITMNRALGSATGT